MNYRHAFHAGNFADVVKHVVLTRILVHLREKPAPFRVIDTHAGAGRYDLDSDEARRGDEWRDGIGRLRAADLPAPVAALLAPYLDVINAFNPAPPPEDMDASPDALSQASAQPHAVGLQAYPGSPLIARALLRPQDRMVACELEPQARKRLIAALYRDAQARVVDLDGWTALPAFVPPKERRGVVLIDPPFERPDEFEAMASGFNAAFAKWPTGVYVLWYPIKALRPAAQFGARVAAVVVLQPAGAGKSLPAGNPAARNLREKCLRVEFHRAATQPAEGGLGSAGLLIVNPPWMLAQELGVIMPALTAILGQDATARFRIDHPSP